MTTKSLNGSPPLDRLVVFVGVLKPDGTLIEANRAALKAAQLQAEDVLNKPFEETYWWSYSPDIQAELRAAIQSAAAGETPRRYDVKVRFGEDRFITIDFALVPLFDEAGNITRLISSGVDITDRKRAEELLRQSEDRLRLALNIGSMGTWDWNIQDNKMVWSENLASIFGLSDTLFDETYDGFLKVVHPEDRTLVEVATARAVNEKAPYDIEFRTLLADGRSEWIASQAQAIHDAEGNVTHLIGIARNVNARKQVEAERESLLLLEQTARAEAEAATLAKDEFLAVISHELRSPLNAILGWTRILRSKNPDESTISQALETIERSGRVQQKLIDDLLDVSRIISGKLRLDAQPIDLHPIIEAASEVMQLAAEAKNIELQMTLEPGAGYITGDADRMQQVIWNLLSNAIKFTPPNGQVRISLERNGPYVQIEVADTGKGINPDFLPFIFERYRQSDTSNTRRHGGLGLGLSLVRHLVELHGGRVTAKSAGEGKGATFCIRLPVRALGKESFSAHRTPSGETPAVQPLPLNGLRLLVVDDQLDAREMLSILLRQFGAQVTLAASAAEAMSIVVTNQLFDLIISDISMPDEDGYSLIRKIRNLPANAGGQIPAIALTAFGRSVDRIRALTAGFQMHIPKPVDADELVIVISSLTGRSGKL